MLVEAGLSGVLAQLPVYERPGPSLICGVHVLVHLSYATSSRGPLTLTLKP